MTGPRKIVDLDSTPSSEWRLDRSAVHLYQNKLWSHLASGCAMCFEANSNNHLAKTLQSQDDEHITLCLTHGALKEYTYTIKRLVTIELGGQTHQGETKESDVVLIPFSMPDAEVTDLISRLINSVMEVEIAQDILDDDTEVE